MANYYGVGRSNYFNVKNEEAFETWADDIGLSYRKVEGEAAATGAYSCGTEEETGEFPCAPVDENEEPVDGRDYVRELSQHLAEETPFVWMEVGHEKMRYLHGSAFTVAASSEANPYTDETHFRRLTLYDIYDKCKEVTGYTPSRAEY